MKKEFTPVVLHVPHASTVIPEAYAGSFLCDVGRELRLMTDRFTDVLFDCRHEAVVFPISRLICDAERFRRDEDEPMALRGMGAVYTRTHDGKALRKIGKTERETILQTWYDPHHAVLEAQVGRRLDAFGYCLIVDCHSFSPVPLPHEPEQDPARPDICVGTDDFHTPERLAQAVMNAASSRGYTVKRNDPFAGSLVPSRYYRRDRRVLSVMLEVNRALYLDGDAPCAGFGRLKADLAEIAEAADAFISENPAEICGK